ncbi:MAG TPA: helix-turn-helix transcriptional regulator [Chthoniobacteraceae bacterium]|jgi:transcriptional regulator with XRE-family HTH domain
MPEPKNALGPVIKETRLAAGWSLDQLAARLTHEGWTCATDQLARIEGQEEGIRDFELLYFAAALGVSADELWKRLMQRMSEPYPTL